VSSVASRREFRVFQPGARSVRARLVPAILLAIAVCWPGEVRATCSTTSTAHCLQGKRFRVEVEWSGYVGDGGDGMTVPGATADSGLFYFYGPNNWEVLVKLLDACQQNDRFWVFAAAATSLQYVITVTDTLTGAVRTYSNPLDVSAPAVTDTEAFATCSGEGSQPKPPAPLLWATSWSNGGRMPAVLQSTDGGESWQAIHRGRGFRGLYFLDEMRGFAVEATTGGDLVHATVDGGRSWLAVGRIADAYLLGVGAFSAEDVFAFGSIYARSHCMLCRYPPIVATSQDAGRTWGGVLVDGVPWPAPLTTGIAEAGCLTGDGRGVVAGNGFVGMSNFVLVSESGSAAWASSTSWAKQIGGDTSVEFRLVDCPRSSEVWLVGSTCEAGCGDERKPLLLFSPDGGSTWDDRTGDLAQLGDGSGAVQSFSFLDGEVGWAVLPAPGSAHVVAHTVDGGRHWDDAGPIDQGGEFDGATYRSFGGMLFWNESDGVVVGGYGDFPNYAPVALYTRDGGGTWRAASLPPDIDPISSVVRAR
jgi:hypothetical protein